MQFCKVHITRTSAQWVGLLCLILSFLSPVEASLFPAKKKGGVEKREAPYEEGLLSSLFQPSRLSEFTLALQPILSDRKPGLRAPEIALFLEQDDWVSEDLKKPFLIKEPSSLSIAVTNSLSLFLPAKSSSPKFRHVLETAPHLSFKLSLSLDSFSPSYSFLSPGESDLKKNLFSLEGPLVAYKQELTSETHEPPCLPLLESHLPPPPKEAPPTLSFHYEPTLLEVPSSLQLLLSLPLFEAPLPSVETPRISYDLCKVLRITLEPPSNLSIKESVFHTSALTNFASIKYTPHMPMTYAKALPSPVEATKVSFPFNLDPKTPLFIDYLSQVGFILPKLSTAPLESITLTTITPSLFGDRRPLSHIHQSTVATKELNRLHRLTGYDLLLLPTLDSLSTESFTDEFDFTMRALSPMGKDGVIFSLSLSPQMPEEFEPMPHRIYFILDRSSSVEKHRLETFKKAITQALFYLDTNAHFNVVLMDQESTLLSNEDLRPTRASMQYVQKALQQVNRGKQASLHSLSTILSNLKEKARETGEVYTVVLLSNGQYLKNIRIHKETLSQFISDIPSTFSLFTSAVSDQNNLEMLDLMARLGKGNLFYTKTHAAFPRKFASFMKKLRRPIAKDIALSSFGKASPFIDLGPFSPLFYSDKPYTLIGQTTVPESVPLFLQGHLGNQNIHSWIQIKKTLSLKNPTPGGLALEKEVMKQRAFQEYVRFLQTEDASSLVEANKILSHSDRSGLYQ